MLYEFKKYKIQYSGRGMVYVRNTLPLQCKRAYQDILNAGIHDKVMNLTKVSYVKQKRSLTH